MSPLTRCPDCGHPWVACECDDTRVLDIDLQDEGTVTQLRQLLVEPELRQLQERRRRRPGPTWCPGSHRIVPRHEREH